MCSSDLPPQCRHVGSDSEGWYDPCTGALVKYATCGKCTVSCDKIGSKSEGWYASCGSTVSLVAWAMCGTGTWACAAEPFDACTGHPAPCFGEGAQVEGARYDPCCPGLTAIEAATWDGRECLYPNCLCQACTYCGDGRCVPPESRCNCPEDCLPGTIPLPPGGLCQVSTDCAEGLGCILPAGGAALPGVCTTICNPMSMSPVAQCPRGFDCVTLPEHQAPGFCLQACGPDGSCPYPLACGAPGGLDGFPRTCFAW